MKHLSLVLLIFVSLVACKTHTGRVIEQISRSGIQTIDTSDMTNNFYDNTETNPLQVKELLIEGEVANPGKVDFSGLPVHSVIVKETLLDSTGSDKFVGAYRYDGYSLFDILDKRILRKKNEGEFKPIIDLYIEVENAKGEKVTFSWGEIYYPNNLHKILLASAVSRIVPSKTKELWPLPAESRLVSANDLITERNISSPVKITVRSYPKSFVTEKGMSPMYSPQVNIFSSSKQVGEITEIPLGVTNTTFNTIFYGRGRGIHSTTPFSGNPVKEILLKYYPFTRQNLQSGMICFTGKDGYRCVVSYSELFNRNDQQEFLIIKTQKGEDGGLYRIFPASDFFSDRAIKSLSEIHLGW